MKKQVFKAKTTGTVVPYVELAVPSWSLGRARPTESHAHAVRH